MGFGLTSDHGGSTSDEAKPHWDIENNPNYEKEELLMVMTNLITLDKKHLMTIKMTVTLVMTTGQKKWQLITHL